MELVKEGYYRAVATPVETENGTVWAQFGYTKNDTKQAAITFEILDTDEAGRKLTWFGYFTEKTYERTLQSLRYCGFKGDDLSSLNEQDLSQEVSITVQHEEYDGKINARVAWVNASGGGGVKLQKPMSKDDMRKFAASMRGRVARVGEVNGTKAERGAKSNGNSPAPDFDRPAPDSEDIPF